jgi:hypothetical protein
MSTTTTARHRAMPATGHDGYREVQDAIQTGMDRLAARRRFPVFG